MLRIAEFKALMGAAFFWLVVFVFAFSIAGVSFSCALLGLDFLAARGVRWAMALDRITRPYICPCNW